MNIASSDKILWIPKNLNIMVSLGGDFNSVMHQNADSKNRLPSYVKTRETIQTLIDEIILTTYMHSNTKQCT